MYTVQSFLAVLVRESSIRGSQDVQQAWLEKKNAKITFEQQELEKDVENESEAWDSIAGAGDGGDPVPVAIKRPAISAVLPRTSTKRASTPIKTEVGGLEGVQGQRKSPRAVNSRDHGNVSAQDSNEGSIAPKSQVRRSLVSI